MRRRTLPLLILLAALFSLPVAAQSPPPLALDGRLVVDAAAHIAVGPVEPARLPESDPLRLAWQQFELEQGPGWRSHVDIRTGVPALVTGPGIAWFDPDRPRPSCAELEAMARAFLAAHERQVAVPLDQLVFEPSSCQAVPGGDLRVWFTQRAGGVPVAGAHFVLDVVRGRLVDFGGTLMTRVRRGVQPALTATEARAIAWRHAGIDERTAYELDPPALRLVPIDPRGDGGRAWDGTRGAGLAHRLAWHVTLRTAVDGMSWSADVDADSGKVTAFRLDTQFGYLTGDVHPLTRDGIGWEGTRQPGFPMPFMYVYQDGQPVGTSDRGGWAGCSQWGLQSTLLFKGPYWRIENFCYDTAAYANCPVSHDFSGTDGTNCDVPTGHNAGDDNASRDVFYHLNRAAEKGRYYFPTQPWYQTQQAGWVNQTTMKCNGYIDSDGLHYGVSDWYCRNFGEIEAVILHEWGHGVAWQDGAPPDSPSEAESDAAPLIETRLSCIGRGAEDDLCDACGDGCVSCNGLRDQDWDAHEGHTPWTWHNLCVSGGGPCGKSDYDEGAILNQALFDFATRDLPDMGVDEPSAWQLLDRLYYLSRVNSTGNAYNCTWGVGTDGCSVDSWYTKFRRADDDDGILSNGTPHAAALFAAFNRHEIACLSASDPQNQNHTSCGAIGTPELTAIDADGQKTLHWAAVSGATG